MSTRDALERSHLTYTDLKDQPASSKYLIIEDSPMHRSVFLVDEIKVDKEYIVGFREAHHVITFSHLFPWKLVDTGYAIPLSNGELMEIDAKEALQVVNYRKELDKKYAPEEEELGPGPVINEKGQKLYVGQHI